MSQNTNSLTTNEDQIRSIINDMCNLDYKLGMKHMHPNCVFVRPSGNPLDMIGWEKMMTNDDVKVTSNDLVNITPVRF
jgi:hypothetical protein